MVLQSDYHMRLLHITLIFIHSLCWLRAGAQTDNSTASCLERCLEPYFPGKPCYCNAACMNFENCCYDYVALCNPQLATNDSWVTFNGHIYKYTVDGTVNAVIANQLCRQLGALLVSINTKEEFEFIQDEVLRGRTISAFIGGTDSLTEGRWMWADGTVMTLPGGDWDSWYTGEPDNDKGAEHCSVMTNYKYWETRKSVLKTYVWRDYTCEFNAARDIQGYICEGTTKCDPNPCENGGSCIYTGQTAEYECVCPSDFAGDICQYEVPKDGFWTFCGETNLTSDEGVVISPLYPKNYPANIRCRWYITVTEGTAINFRINDVSIEPSKHCYLDALTIYDGDQLNNNSVLFGPYCSSDLTEQVYVTSSNTALVVFDTDRDVSSKGFQLSYARHVCGQGTGLSGCGTKKMFTSLCGDIYVGSRLDIVESECEWMIHIAENYRINVTFNMFQLADTGQDCMVHGLEVYNGPNINSSLIGRYCGHRAPFTVYSSANQLYIRLTNSSILSHGFHLQYQTYDTSKFNVTNTLQSIEGTFGTLYLSDRFLFLQSREEIVYKWHVIVPYGMHMQLMWNIITNSNNTHIKVFKGMTRFIFVEEHYDVTDNPVTRNVTTIPYFQIVMNLIVTETAKIEFNATFNAKEWKTDLSNCYRPYFYDNISSAVTENNLISSLQPVMLAVTSSDGYKAGLYCKWLIRGKTAQQLIFDIVDSNIYPVTESCIYDGVVIYTGPNTSYPKLGPFCGQSSLIGKSLNTQSNEILVVFYSDTGYPDRTNGRFKAVIHQENTECPLRMMNDPSTELFTAKCGTIMSPNFPEKVQQGIWFWTFQTPPNHYISLKVYYVRGPGIADQDCQQSLKVIEVPKDSSTLRQYEQDIIRLCGTTELFVPPDVIKIAPQQKMGIELNTVINAIPQTWQFKMSFTTHMMKKPKEYPMTNSCPVDYIEWRGNCYRYYQWISRHYLPEDYPWQKLWETTADHCEKLNETLLTINDEEESYFLKYTLAHDWFWDPAAPFIVNTRLIYLGLKSKDGEYEWTDGVKMSYADWYRPGPPWSQNVLFGDTSLLEIVNTNVPQPSISAGSLCAGMIPISPFKSLNWVKIPCDYPIFRAGVICKKHAEGYNEKNNELQSEVISFNQSFKACPDGYFMIQGHCYMLFTNYVHQVNESIIIEEFSMEEAILSCNDHGGTIPTSDVISHILKNYLPIWNHTTVYGDILIARNLSSECFFIKVGSVNGEIQYADVNVKCEDVWKYQLKISNVICTTDPISITESCGSQEFECTNHMCISVDSVCDTINDCMDNSDEQHCDCGSTMFRCTNGKCLSLSLRCDFVDNCGDMSDEKDCVPDICTDTEFRCLNKQCINKDLICDFKLDCVDGSDEDPTLCGGNCKGFLCYSGMCIKNRMEKDGITDCPGLLYEDEIFRNGELQTFFDLEENIAPEEVIPTLGCAEGGEYVKCHLYVDKCYDRRKTCIYDTVMVNEARNFTIEDTCRDGYHLREHCDKFECPGMFHCPNSYCIPIRKVCDGRKDCPMGQDETNCNSYNCQGLFKCKSSGICIPHSEVCNGIIDCQPYKEDEKYCGDIDPLCNICSCKGLVATCRHTNLTVLPVVYNQTRQLRALFINFNTQLTVSGLIFDGFHWLNKLSLSNNSLTDLQKHNFESLVNLHYLDLSYNQLSIINYEIFYGLENLKMLDLSHNNLYVLGQFSFKYLTSLEHLKMEQNPNLIDVHVSSLSKLHQLHTLNSDAYKFCCIAKQVEVCTPAADEFSNCEDLMANKTLQICIWILGIIAAVGNFFVVIWRIITDKNKVSSMFIINLGCSDLLMGVYLLIIAGVDYHYRGSYIVHADSWRSSTLCQIAGVLAMLSSEVSIYMLTAITLDRCITILFPLKFGKFRMKHARFVVITGWVICFGLSILPVLKLNYFGNAFFGRTGVCLPFQVSAEKLPGWEYSVFIFLVLNFISFIVIFISYTAIFVAVKSSIKSVGARTSNTTDEYALAKKLVLIVITDFCCWVPIIIIGFATLGGATIPPQVSAWIAVFILPLNSAINPLLYTISSLDCKKRKHNRQKSYYSNTMTSGISGSVNNVTKGLSRISSKENNIKNGECDCNQVTFNTENISDSSKL